MDIDDYTELADDIIAKNPKLQGRNIRCFLKYKGKKRQEVSLGEYFKAFRETSIVTFEDFSEYFPKQFMSPTVFGHIKVEKG